MRFHIGFSKRVNIKTIIQFLGFVFVALCAFFGIDKITAHAAVVSSNPNGYSVNAFRPLYYNETNGTCSRSNSTGCSNNNNIYNATGCNNYTTGGVTYCMFRNNNSTGYFSLASMTCDNNNNCFVYANNTYGSNTTYRPHSKLVWTWKQANINYCSSGNLDLYFNWLVTSNNTILTNANRCAFDLNTVSGSTGFCSLSVGVNGNSYAAVSLGDGKYKVNIPKPTTDLTFTIPDIQPFLKETAGEGGTYSDKMWNYGIAITGYECNSSSSNTDSNAIINNQNQNTQTIITNDNNNTNTINSSIHAVGDQVAESASQIVESIDDLKENINDSDTSEAGSGAGVAFGEQEFDGHGVSGIVTAPLRMYSHILNSNNRCDSLDFNINMGNGDKAVRIPGGCILWDNVPSELELLFQTIVFGFLGYFVLKDIVKTIHEVLDPNDLNDYVIDL